VPNVYYRSPESFLNNQVSSKVDVWSAGVIFFRLLTLKHPFNGFTRANVIMGILRKEITEISYPYSDNLKKFVKKCLEKKPEERISIKDSLSEIDIIAKTI
jgi:serine/threonine protein kinase